VPLTGQHKFQAAGFIFELTLIPNSSIDPKKLNDADTFSQNAEFYQRVPYSHRNRFQLIHDSLKRHCSGKTYCVY
jgi:hypothetical protein